MRRFWQIWHVTLRRVFSLGLAVLTIGMIVLVQGHLPGLAQSPPAPTEAPASETLGLEKTPEEAQRWARLAEADRLYQSGKTAEATAIYREVKPPFDNSTQTIEKPRPEPFSDPTLLPPGGKVYWREAQAGIEAKLETRILVPLRLLSEQYPQFIPGHVVLAQALKEYKQPREALSVLERATTLYPDQPDLVKVRVQALADAEQYMEASIAARQFVLLYPDHPASPEMAQLAQTNLERFQGAMQQRLTGNAIANLFTGVLGYALTGSLYGPLSALQSGVLLLQGESSVGAQVSEQAKNQLEMVEDPQLLEYVRGLGTKVAAIAGRQDFQYEFNIILEDKINAFALPGGKIFLNAGAIKSTNSEAELAGLLAHEVSHAVLSHGFQLITEGTLLDNVTQFIPLGGTIAQLFVLDYSREMERQADILGTRMLTSLGYAADGLRNLMVTLKQESRANPYSWLATHPVTEERVRYLEELIERNGYNRYAYEGVERHGQMRQIASTLLAEAKQRQESNQ